MSAREKCPKPGCGALKLIAKPCTDFDCPQDWSVKRLIAAGYSIIPPGGMHEPTLEKAAQHLERHPSFGDGKWAAGIVRALSHEGERKG